MRFLFDASAILTLLHDEPGADQVIAALASSAECCMSVANHAEVISRSLDRGVSSDAIEPLLAQLAYRILPVDIGDGVLAGLLRNRTRPLGLSLGDRLCLATASRLGCPVLTADRPWLELAGPLQLDIRCIRPDTY